MKVFEKLPKRLALSGVFIMLILLIVNPEKYMGYMTDGLRLFSVSVLPSMFPFFFFSKILTGLGTAEILGKALNKPVKKLFNAPSIAGYVFIMSVLCGYPIGAKLLSDCYDSGVCNKTEIKSMMAFTSTSGPLFVLGTIGTSLIGDYTAGIIILSAHYLGAIVNGLVFKTKYNNNEICVSVPKADVDNLLSDAVFDSIKSILAVGSYIAIFNLVIGALYDLNIMGFLCGAFAKIKVDRKITEGVVAGIFEVTRGSVIISDGGLSKCVSVPIITALVSFGGLSVTLQSLSFISSTGIKARYYLATKTSQAILSYFLATLICSFVYL